MIVTVFITQKKATAFGFASWSLWWWWWWWWCTSRYRMMIKRGGSSGFSEGSPPTSPFRDSSVINQENRARKAGRTQTKVQHYYNFSRRKKIIIQRKACSAGFLTPFEVSSDDIDLLQFSQKVLFLNDNFTQTDPHSKRPSTDNDDIIWLLNDALANWSVDKL